VIPLQDTCPHLRPQGKPRQALAYGVGGDGGVVVVAPERGGQLGVGQHPAEPQAGQRVSLRKPAHHNGLMVSTPEARRALTVEFGPPIHLIGQQPGARRLGRRHHGVHLSRREDRSRGIVGVGHVQDLGAGTNRRFQLLQIQLPGPFRAQVNGHYFGPEGPRHARYLHIVGEHGHHAIARLHQVPDGQEVGLGRTVRDQQVLMATGLVQPADGFFQRRRPIGLDVAQLDRSVYLIQLFPTHELVQKHGMDTGLGEIVVHLVLPQRQKPLRLKRVDSQYNHSPK